MTSIWSGIRRNQILSSMLITEKKLRRMVREMISSDRTSHSQGWIDPKGDYHHDPEGSEHGEWAAHKLVDFGMIDELLEKIEAEVNFRNTYATRRMKVPNTDDIDVIYQSIPLATSEVARDMLLELGWGAVSNAYELSVKYPNRSIIERWIDLGMEAGADPDGTFKIWSGSKLLVSGNMEEVEKFSRRLGRHG